MSLIKRNVVSLLENHLKGLYRVPSAKPSPTSNSLFVAKNGLDDGIFYICRCRQTSVLHFLR